MIRYAYAGRKYPRYQPDVQGVFHWTSVGTSGFVPVPPGTHKRRFHNWLLYGGPYNSVFVWQNAGSAETAAVVVATFEGARPRHRRPLTDDEDIMDIVDISLRALGEFDGKRIH